MKQTEMLTTLRLKTYELCPTILASGRRTLSYAKIMAYVPGGLSSYQSSCCLFLYLRKLTYFQEATCCGQSCSTALNSAV